MMPLSRVLRVGLFVLILAVCGCSRSGTDVILHGPYIKFTQYRLSNGLRVILAPDQASALVSVSISYDVGSRNEKVNEAGLAHLCEHVMFEGSKHVATGEHFSLIRGVGGSTNADTTKDSTTFYETVPANQLPLALYLEADRLNSLDIRPDRFEQARAEVLDEKREEHDDVPYDGPLDRCQQMAFGKFAYGHSIAGNDESIASLRLQDAQQFLKRYYAPSRAAVCICGRFDPVQANALVARYFGSASSGVEPPPVDCDEPFERPRLAPTAMDAPFSPQGLYIRGFVNVGMNDPDYEPLLLASVILGSGEVNRLRSRLVEHLGATSAIAFEIQYRDGNYAVDLAIPWLPPAGVP
jgi:predicted Zn-dependent peptidase